MYYGNKQGLPNSKLQSCIIPVSSKICLKNTSTCVCIIHELTIIMDRSLNNGYNYTFST